MKDQAMMPASPNEPGDRRGFDPRLYLVTDPALGGPDLVARVLAAVAGGVTLVQLRDKRASDAALVTLARALMAGLAPAGVPLIVNDRVEVALAADADGLHVGQSDMEVAKARARLGPTRILGLSLERIGDLDGVDAAAVDYVAASPVFGTATKPDIAPPLGLDGVRRLRRGTALPLVGIGGIGTENAAAVIEAGADGVAVVSAILAAADPEAAARTMRRVVDRALAGRGRGQSNISTPAVR
jgi:thiamine-phosphate pyrophosphorylase